MSTIVAISTAPGVGGIGIIRMSGEESFEILEKIFKPKRKEKIENIKGYNIILINVNIIVICCKKGVKNFLKNFHHIFLQ